MLFGIHFALPIHGYTKSLISRGLLTSETKIKNDQERHGMDPVALLTPTYGRDLELCTLLCESIDRHVSSFSKHYLLVPDSDVPLFSHLENEHRSVLPVSMFLPKWLRPLP